MGVGTKLGDLNYPSQLPMAYVSRAGRGAIARDPNPEQVLSSGDNRLDLPDLGTPRRLSPRYPPSCTQGVVGVFL